MLPSLGEIPKKRKELGLTQSRLAASAGVSQSIIAKIEAGSVDPSYSVVQRLFGALERAGVESPARRVDELISRPVVTVARTQLVRDAVDLMRRRGYSQLPVFEGGSRVEFLKDSPGKLSAKLFSFTPTASLTRPPMPVSISSNTIVRGNSDALATVFKTSINREASPPEATFASGLIASPTLAEK